MSSSHTAPAPVPGRAGWMIAVAAAAAFLAGRIRFPAIVRTVAHVLRAADQWAAQPATVEDVLDAQDWARDRAGSAINREVVGSR